MTRGPATSGRWRLQAEEWHGGVGRRAASRIPRALEAEWRSNGQLHMVRQGVIRTKAVKDIMDKAVVTELDLSKKKDEEKEETGQEGCGQEDGQEGRGRRRRAREEARQEGRSEEGCEEGRGRSKAKADDAE